MNITVELPRDAALLKHMAKFKPRHPKAAALTEPSGGQQLDGDIPDAPSNWNVQKAASRLLGKSRSRNSA
jgi:hypothetical protein